MVALETRQQPRPPAHEKLEHKVVTLDRINVDSTGTGSFSGYGSVFDNVDSYGDIVVRGAYKDTLPDFVKEGFIAFQHGWQSEPIAYVTNAKEDNFGLFIECQFHSTDLAQNIRKIVNERLAAGKSVGLSIGYTVDHADMRKDGVRMLNKLTLFEVSLVNMPANRLAVVTDAKAADGAVLRGDVRSAFIIAGRKEINWNDTADDDNPNDVGNDAEDVTDGSEDEYNDPEDSEFTLESAGQLDDKSLRLLVKMGALKPGAADGHWVSLNGGHILIGGDHADVGTRFNVGMTEDDFGKLSVGDDAHTVFKMSPELQTRLKALHANHVQLSVGRGGWKDASGQLAEENALALHFSAPSTQHDAIVQAMHDQAHDWHQAGVLVQHYVPVGTKGAELQAVIDLGRGFPPEEMTDLAGGLKQHFSGWTFTQENGSTGSTRLVISNIKAWGGVPDKMFKQQVDTFAHHLALAGEQPRARYRSVLNDTVDSSQPRSEGSTDVHGDLTRGRNSNGAVVGRSGGGSGSGDKPRPGVSDQASPADRRGRPTSGPAGNGSGSGVHGDVPGRKPAGAGKKAEDTDSDEAGTASGDASGQPRGGQADQAVNEQKAEEGSAEPLNAPDNLPDVAFAYIEYGTTKSVIDGKSYPLERRRYAHHDAEGNVDAELLRAAIRGVEQEPLAPAAKAVVLEHLRDHAQDFGIDMHTPERKRRPFAEHIEQTLEAVDGLTRRVQSRVELQAKDGRQLSHSNRSRLEKIRDSLHQHADHLDGVLNDNDSRFTQNGKLQGTLHNNGKPDPQDDLQGTVSKTDPRAAAAHLLVKHARRLHVALLGMQFGPEAKDTRALGHRAAELLPDVTKFDADFAELVADFAVNPSQANENKTALLGQPMNVMRVITDLRQISLVGTKADADVGRIEMLAGLVGAVAGLMDTVQSQLDTWAKSLDPEYSADDEDDDEDDSDDSEDDESDLDDQTEPPPGAELKEDPPEREREDEAKASGEALSRVELELLEQSIRLADLGLSRSSPLRLGVKP